MKFSSDLLLPRIKRRGDKKLENFIVSNISNELKSGEDYDPVQMQYFLESVFDSRGRMLEVLKKLEKAI